MSLAQSLRNKICIIFCCFSFVFFLLLLMLFKKYTKKNERTLRKQQGYTLHSTHSIPIHQHNTATWFRFGIRYDAMPAMPHPSIHTIYPWIVWNVEEKWQLYINKGRKIINSLENKAKQISPQLQKWGSRANVAKSSTIAAAFWW